MSYGKNIRILIAENSSVSQLVAKKYLEKAGYQADGVDNGQKAVEAVRTKKYGLVLMDVQMPVMDGLEAARAIRLLEKETPVSIVGKHLPIIAMADQTLEKQIAQCSSAGMDDCIPLPVRKENLLTAVEKWIPQNLSPEVLAACDSSEPKAENSQEANDTLVFNMERALSEFDGNWTFLKGIFGEFFKQVDQQMVLIIEAIEHGDASTVRSQAHSIKGGAANLTLDKLAKIASDLETRGKVGQLEGADVLVRRMESFIQQLKDCVGEFRNI
jgi:CheY-like chemotaxis protein/HPt (histidine-containing phosphotransfer) domain-containing protein